MSAAITPKRGVTPPMPAHSPLSGLPFDVQSDPRFKAIQQAAETSVSAMFKLLESYSEAYRDQGEEVVRKARATIALRLEDDAANEHVIDLKTGPGPHMTTRLVTASSTSALDVIVSVDTKARLLNLMTQREDGLSLYKSGAIKLVKGSMSTLLRLRGLQELAERWKQDLMPSAASAAEPHLDDGMEGKEGYLEKRSEWIRRWNSRWVAFRFNERNRPQLRYWASQAAQRAGLPAKGFLELHSGYSVQVNEADLGPLAFALVDKRGTGATIVLRAASQRQADEWMAIISQGIAARSRALGAAHGALSATSVAEHGFAAPTNLLDVLLATQRAVAQGKKDVAALEERLKEAGDSIAALQAKAAQADEHLILGAVEGDGATLRRWLGWKWIPVGAVLALTGASASRLALAAVHSAVETTGAALGGLLGETDAARRSGLGALSLLALLSLVARTVQYSSAFELARRRWRVWTLAVSVIWRMKLASLRAETLPPVHRDAMWAVEFRTNAERLYALSLELRGLWVKSAQFLGARPDVVPPSAIQVLQRLHDAVPPTPFAQVRALVEAELQLPLAKMFATFDEEPLASASIGQVHRATLLSTGASVVVKVQHPGIEPKIRQDLANMAGILNFVERLERATGGDDLELKPILEEWTREVVKELDFVSENRNMADVGRNLAADASVHAALPCPIPGMCTRRVLAMRFVNGAKINDPEGLRRLAGVETDAQRTALAEDITNAFARQLFVDGVFQADPHPGNILVCRRDGLEPGAVIALPPCADAARAIPVLLDFGLTKRLPRSKRLAFSRLICAGQSLDVAGLLLSFDEMALIMKREDPFEDLNEFRFVFRETTGGAESRAATMAHLQKARDKWEALPRSERNPVEAFPSELMLFFRTVFLLRGLCTSLNVRVKYLRIMGAWARRSMLERYPAAASSPAMGSPVRPPHNDDVATRVAALLSGVVGAQVTCVRAGTTVVRLCTGRVHDLDSRPVRAETLFPCLGLAQGVAQLCVRQACLDASVPLDTPVARVWEAFRDKALTIADLVSGDASKLKFAAAALPAVFSVQSMGRTEELIGFVEGISAGTEDGGAALPWELSVLAFAWGYAMAGLVRALDKGDAHALAARVARMGGEGVCARLDKTLPPHAGKHASEATKAACEAEREKEREAVAAQVAALSVDVDTVFKGMVDLDKLWEGGGEVPQAGAAGEFDATAVLKSLPSIKGREYLVDPRVFNHFAALTSVTPSGNLLASADGLVALFGSASCPLPSTFDGALSGDVLGEGLGLKLMQFADKDKGVTYRGVGQVAFGGSFVLALPELELTMAVLVNDLTLERAATRAVVEELLKECGLVPMSDY